MNKGEANAKNLNIYIQEEKDVVVALKSVAKEKRDVHRGENGDTQHQVVRGGRGTRRGVLKLPIQFKDIKTREDKIHDWKLKVKRAHDQLEKAAKQQKPTDQAKFEVETLEEELKKLVAEHVGLLRADLRDAYHFYYDGYAELASKMAAVAKFGRHLADQIPQGSLAPGQELPPFTGTNVVNQIFKDFEAAFSSGMSAALAPAPPQSQSPPSEDTGRLSIRDDESTEPNGSPRVDAETSSQRGSRTDSAPHESTGGSIYMTTDRRGTDPSVASRPLYGNVQQSVPQRPVSYYKDNRASVAYYTTPPTPDTINPMASPPQMQTAIAPSGYVPASAMAYQQSAQSFSGPGSTVQPLTPSQLLKGGSGASGTTSPTGSGGTPPSSAVLGHQALSASPTSAAPPPLVPAGYYVDPVTGQMKVVPAPPPMGPPPSAGGGAGGGQPGGWVYGPSGYAVPQMSWDGAAQQGAVWDGTQWLYPGTQPATTG
ncbi:hypothetical protein DFJ73DRAFT_942096 [Zopfochytrium polystomum]|nr:hypothetical protein DFJ73DRAFT_942096 [Zopfochytrium polystomum]